MSAPYYTPEQQAYAQTYTQQLQQYPPAQYGAYGQPVKDNPYAQSMAQQPQGPQYTYAHRRQKVSVHILLALTTAGLGNWAYSAWAKSKMAARWEW